MNWRRYKHLTVYLVLCLFLSTKLAGLHVLTHENDPDHLSHCVTCELAALNNHTPVVPVVPAEIVIDQTDFFVSKEKAVLVVLLFDQSISTDQLFSRPPPHLAS